MQRENIERGNEIDIALREIEEKLEFIRNAEKANSRNCMLNKASISVSNGDNSKWFYSCQVYF